MENWTLALIILLISYLTNMVFISVFYHRGLAHQSIRLHPWIRRFVIRCGNWLTGIDPKAWVCMHRMHHAFSDGPEDPHSPQQFGYFGVLLGQLHSYQRTVTQLARHRENYEAFVTDLEFDVNWINKRDLWFLPYVAHVLIGVIFGVLLGNAFIPLFYALSMMAHPLYGWLVNSFAHGFGYRNFELPDSSTNNTVISLLLFGEGLQNNHHSRPQSANFAVKKGEIDLGYLTCKGLEKCGLLSIPHPDHLNSRVS